MRHVSIIIGEHVLAGEYRGDVFRLARVRALHRCLTLLLDSLRDHRVGRLGQEFRFSGGQPAGRVTRGSCRRTISLLLDGGIDRNGAGNIDTGGFRGVEHAHLVHGPGILCQASTKQQRDAESLSHLYFLITAICGIAVACVLRIRKNR